MAHYQGEEICHLISCCLPISLVTKSQTVQFLLVNFCIKFPFKLSFIVFMIVSYAIFAVMYAERDSCLFIILHILQITAGQSYFTSR